MLFKTVLTTGLMAMGVVAHQLPKRGERIGCGTRGPSENQRKVQHDLALQEAADRNLNLAISNSNAKKEDIEVNVYMHSVSAKNGTLLSDKVLKAQFDVMANIFSDYDIKMHLAGTSRTVNPKWADDGDEMAMKLALRRGTYADLNMYYLDDLDAYGYCYYPDAYRVNSTGFWQDGCTVMATTVPGGSEAPYNHGMTSVHEAGHWFGLIHTFGETENGCDGPGDEIHDTPAQRTESRGCPVGRDSCPGKPGVDPIHNYMDYSDDTCYDEFTPGQVRRIRSMWDNFRA